MAIPRPDAGSVTKPKKRKPRRYTLPKTFKPEATTRREKPKAGPVRPQSTGKVSRPAPKRQPGPVSAKERRRVERHRETEQYQQALRKARVKGPGGRRGTKRPGGDDKSDYDRERAQRYVAEQYRKHGGLRRASERDTTVPPDVYRRVSQRRISATHKQAQAEKTAPVLKALEQTTRPLHGVAAGTRAAIKGKNVPKAIGRGLANKDKSTFSDVLKDVGVPKQIAGPAGFALDVGLDPTTFVAGGVASVGAKAGAKAASKAAKVTPTPKRAPTTKKEAARAKERARGGGASAPTLSERARRRAEARDARQGVSIRFVGREAPGVRKVTAKAAAPLRRAGRTEPAQAVKRAVGEARPTLVPQGVKRAEYEEVRRAARTARAKEHMGRRRAETRAKAYKKAFGKNKRERERNYARVADAIESGTVKDLPDNLRRVAGQLKDEFTYARQVSRRSGVKVAERKGYIPHQRTAKSLKAERRAMTAESVGQRKIAPGSSKQRMIEKPLAQIRKEDPDYFSQNLPEIYAARMDEATTAAARADLNRRIADVGRTVKRGEDPNLRPGEGLYRIHGSNLEPITSGKLPPQASGRYVVLNEELIRRTVQGMARPGGGTLGKGYDVATGWWKFLATVPNLGFHIRNLLGDTQNAYIAENAARLAKNMVTSGRALKALSKAEAKGVRSLDFDVPVKGGKKQKLLDLAKEAESVGAIRTGFIARELPELQSALRTAAKPHKLPGRRVARWVQNREDLLRLATYIGGKQRGLSPEKAAERAAKFHFDYADLTSTERNVFRRIAPFYTFSARNIPLQFQSYFARPGKFAQYQKVREEVSKAFGLDIDKVEEDLTEYEQRTAPVTIRHKGETFTVSFGASGLPLTDLNELPTTANPAKVADEWMAKALSMLNPAIKSPLEVWSNFSFFFRDQLERETGPYVAAPSLVSKLPKTVRDKLKIISDFRDPRTGESTWGWPAKADYFASLLPGPISAVERGTTKSPQSGVAKGVQYGTGVRVRKVDPVSKQISMLFDEKAAIQKKLGGLRQRSKNGRWIDADNPTPEYTKLLAEQRELDKKIERLRAKRGDIKPKLRVKSKVSWGDSGGGVTWPDEGSSVQWPD